MHPPQPSVNGVRINEISHPDGVAVAPRPLFQVDSRTVPEVDFYDTPIFHLHHAQYASARFRLPRALHDRVFPITLGVVYRRFSLKGITATIGHPRLGSPYVTFSPSERETSDLLASADIVFALQDACFRGCLPRPVSSMMQWEAYPRQGSLPVDDGIQRESCDTRARGSRAHRSA